MTTPQWLKPGIYGALLGAAFLSIAGFSWAGWMTKGDANKMASRMAQSEVVAALVPICVDLSRTDTDRIAKLAAIRLETPYKRREAIMEAGWATVPGSDRPNRDLAQACIAGLELDES